MHLLSFRTSRLTLAVLLALLPAGLACAAEYCTNGDFGSGTGWTNWNGTTAVTADYNCASDVPTGGTSPCLGLTTSASGAAGAYYTLSLQGGRAYVIMAVSKLNITLPDGTHEADFVIRDAAPTNGSDISSNNSTPSSFQVGQFHTACYGSGWNGPVTEAHCGAIKSLVYYCTGAGTQTRYLVLKLWSDRAGGTNVTFDNIRVREVQNLITGDATGVEFGSQPAGWSFVTSGGTWTQAWNDATLNAYWSNGSNMKSDCTANSGVAQGGTNYTYSGGRTDHAYRIQTDWRGDKGGNGREFRVNLNRSGTAWTTNDGGLLFRSGATFAAVTEGKESAAGASQANCLLVMKATGTSNGKIPCLYADRVYLYDQGRVIGRVVDGSGSAISGASITMSGSGLPTYNLTTDTGGCWEQDNAQPGSYDVSASFGGNNANYPGPYSVTGSVPVDCGTVAIVACTPVSIIADPSNQSADVGETATFTVAAGGSAPQYQWQKNTGGGWQDINLANSPSYQTPPATCGDNGTQFRCHVYNTCGGGSSIDSNAATLTVNQVVNPPSISADPQNTTVDAGQTASFSVTASGGTLSYQWQQYISSSWQNIGGAQSTGYTTPTLGCADNGNQYRCVVKNECNLSTDSNAATVTVVDNTKPSVSNVASSSYCVTSGGTVTVTADVSDNCTIQQSGIYAAQLSTPGPNLLLNPSFEAGGGSSITDWTNSTSKPYEIYNSYPSPGGPKDGSKWAGASCAGTNGLKTPELRQTVNVASGDIYQLSVWVSTVGSPAICSAYLQWYDGADPGQEGKCKTVASLTSNTSGWQQLSGYVVPSGSSLTVCLKLSWDCGGSGGGGNFDLAEARDCGPGITASSFASDTATWNSFAITQSGPITVVARDDAGNCGEPISPPVYIQPATPTNVQAVPSTICSGQSSNLSASVGSGETVDWFTGSCGGTPVGSGSPLQVSPTVTTTYYARARAGSSCSSTDCETVTVTVNTAPLVTGDPSSQTKSVGQPVTFTVTATGTPAPTYQWRKNGSIITDENDSSYTIDSVATCDAGSYDCVVTNVCGSDTSDAATLTISGTSAASVVAAKALADSKVVALAGPVVTRAFGGFFYMEDADRASGIRIDLCSGLAAPPEGTKPSVVGVLDSSSGERVIKEAVAASGGSADVPKPVGMNNRAANEPLPVGLYVTVWGIADVPGGATDEFAVLDGSPSGVKVKLYGVSLPTNGQYVKVRGTLGIASGAPVVRVNKSSDLW